MNEEINIPPPHLIMTSVQIHKECDSFQSTITNDMITFIRKTTNKKRLHKPMPTSDLSGREKCSVCGAIRSPHFTRGYYPWKLQKMPMPYCLKKYRLYE